MVTEREQMFSTPVGRAPDGPQPPRPAPIASRGRAVYHNSFDLELHARFMRERAMEEVTRARRLDRARQAKNREARRFRVLAAAQAIRAWFTPRTTSQTEGRSGDAAKEFMIAKSAAMVPAPQSSQRSRRIADSYAGMVVIARGEPSRSGRPRNVKEC